MHKYASAPLHTNCRDPIAHLHPHHCHHHPSYINRFQLPSASVTTTKWTLYEDREVFFNIKSVSQLLDVKCAAEVASGQAQVKVLREHACGLVQRAEGVASCCRHLSSFACCRLCLPFAPCSCIDSCCTQLPTSRTSAVQSACPLSSAWTPGREAPPALGCWGASAFRQGGDPYLLNVAEPTWDTTASPAPVITPCRPPSGLEDVDRAGP